MNLHRKLTAILLALSISTACLTACSDKSEDTKKTERNKMSEVVESELPETDTSDTTSSELSDTTFSDTSDATTSDLSDSDARFHELSDRVIEAGKSVLGLQEADEEQKQDILTKFSASTELYERGAYYTITPEDLDILNCSFNLVYLDKYIVKNLTILSRYVSIEADFRAAIIETVDESAAVDLFSEMLALYSIYDGAKMEQESKDLNYRYYYDYPDNTRFVLIMQSDHSVLPFVYYFIREGNLITLVVYSDELGNTFFDECNDFMVAAGLEDMRALLDSNQPSTDPTDTSDKTDTTTVPADIDIEVNTISAAEFNHVLESNGYSVSTINLGDDYEAAIIASNTISNTLVTYFQFKSDSDAKEEFDKTKESAEEYTSTTNAPFILGDDFIIADEGDTYSIIVYAEDMVITIVNTDGDASAAKEALNLLGSEIK
ncbi:MAG: hypothetical protein J5636_03280 [Clostridiales bacterium]|nr:hypothetical protein [Clostridiales bacterium]